jgi:hypothetical protein
MNIFDRDMSLKANNQHYVNDIDRQTDRRKKRRFEIFNKRITVIVMTEGRLNELN